MRSLVTIPVVIRNHDIILNLFILNSYAINAFDSKTLTYKKTNLEILQIEVGWFSICNIPKTSHWNCFHHLNISDKTKDLDTTHGLCNRISLWSFEVPQCKGKFKRWICNMALEDLPSAYMQGHCFFLNKFDLKVDPLPVSCLYQHWTRWLLHSLRFHFFWNLLNNQKLKMYKLLRYTSDLTRTIIIIFQIPS